MKKYLILLVAGFAAIPVLASATSLPETIVITDDTAIVSTEGQPLVDVITTDEKKDLLAENETVGTEPEILPPNEDDNIIKKKRDEFRMKQKNERENMRLELKKGKEVKEITTMSAATVAPQKSTLQKIKGFFKSFF